MASVFTKIIRGELPARIIWQDADCIVFLPNGHFINPGHALIVPKQEVDELFDLDDALYAKLWRIAKWLAAPVKKLTAAQRVGIAVEGFSVPHVHIHLCPLHQAGDLDPMRQEPWSEAERDDFMASMHNWIANHPYGD